VAADADRLGRGVHTFAAASFESASGKKLNAERPHLTLFDDTDQRGPMEVRKEVDNHNINVLVFDLSITE